MISINETLKPIVSKSISYPKPPTRRLLNRAYAISKNQPMKDENNPYTGVLGGPGIVGGGDYRAVGTNTPLFKKAG